MRRPRHAASMPEPVRRLGWIVGAFGAGIPVGTVLAGTWTVPHLVATGTVLVALIVLMAVVHFVHELVATLDGVRYEMGQRRLSSEGSRRPIPRRTATANLPAGTQPRSSVGV